MSQIDIQKDSTFIDGFEERLQTEGPFSSWNLFRMNYEAALTTMSPSFDGLKALEYLPQMDFLDHQLSTARQVLEEMNGRDRKSTRLNSSHVSISYAVFCLKKNR